MTSGDRCGKNKYPYRVPYKDRVGNYQPCEKTRRKDWEYQDVTETFLDRLAPVIVMIAFLGAVAAAMIWMGMAAISYLAIQFGLPSVFPEVLSLSLTGPPGAKTFVFYGHQVMEIVVILVTFVWCVLLWISAIMLAFLVAPYRSPGW